MGARDDATRPASTGRETSAGRGPGGVVRRLAWFAGLWLAGVATVTIVAYAIRFWLGLG